MKALVDSCMYQCEDVSINVDVLYNVSTSTLHYTIMHCEVHHKLTNIITYSYTPLLRQLNNSVSNTTLTALVVLAHFVRRDNCNNKSIDSSW